MRLPELPVVYTRHAKGRMRWRRIEKVAVAVVLSDPDRVEWIASDRAHVRKTIDGRALRVIVAVEVEQIVVITVMEES